jgi:hypothetical protein
MAFIAPLFAAAAGLGAIGSALLSAAIAVGAMLVVQALTPKPRQSELDAAPTELSLDSDHPREIIFGRAITAGSLVYSTTSGNNNKKLWLVIALADHPCEALKKVWVNGRSRIIDEDGWVNGTNEKLKVRFLSAANAAPSDLVSVAGSEWTADDRFTNGTWVVCEVISDDKVWAGSIPQLAFEVEGMKLYDPRLDTTAGGSGSHRWDNRATWTYSDNPVLAWYLLRRGYEVEGERLFGLRTPADLIDLAKVRAEADYCDTAMPRVGTTNERRYRISGVMQATPGAAPAIEQILAACGGKEIDSGGSIAIQVGVARSVVAALTDDDIVHDAETTRTFKQPANELANAIFGAWRDPAQMWATVGLPPRTSSTDEAADGGRFERSYDLAYVASQTQGQRVMEIFRRLARRQEAFETTLRGRWAGLEAGDWVTITSDRHGWVAKTFEVLSSAVDAAFRVRVVLRETDTTVYDWSTGLELDLLAPEDLGSAAPPSGTVSGLALATVLVPGGAGAERPGLRLTWTAPDDETIDDLLLEFREVGTTNAAQMTIRDVEAGSYTWVAGVQGDVTYEARVLAITTPRRTVAWSGWFAATTATEPQKVRRVVEAPPPGPGTITRDLLDAQAAFELSLATRVDGVLGSLVGYVDEVEKAQAQLAGAWALLRRDGQRMREALEAEVGTARAEVSSERAIRVTERDAMAARIDTVRIVTESAQAAVIDNTLATDRIASRLSTAELTLTQSGLTANAQLILQARDRLDNIETYAGFVTNQAGRVTGMISLSDSTRNGSEIMLQANRIGFWLTQGGTTHEARNILGIGTVDGVPTLAFRGNALLDGEVTVRHLAASTITAIWAEIRALRAGVITGFTGKLRIDLDSEEITLDS